MKRQIITNLSGTSNAFYFLTSSRVVLNASRLGEMMDYATSHEIAFLIEVDEMFDPPTLKFLASREETDEEFTDRTGRTIEEETERQIAIINLQAAAKELGCTVKVCEE